VIVLVFREHLMAASQDFSLEQRPIMPQIGKCFPKMYKQAAKSTRPGNNQTNGMSNDQHDNLTSRISDQDHPNLSGNLSPSSYEFERGT
jgi:hypothetical protein